MYRETLINFLVPIVFIVIFILFYSAEAYSCYSKANKQELEWSYGPFQGCMVKGTQTNDKWIDYDRYRIFDEK